MRDIDRLYNSNSKKKDGVYDKFVKNNPRVADRLFSSSQMPTEGARRNEDTYVDYADELSRMRTMAIDRFKAENPLPSREVTPAPSPAIKNNRFYQGNATKPTVFNGTSEKASPYSVGMDRIVEGITGKPSAERQSAIEKALAPYLQQRSTDQTNYFGEKDIAEKPVSMMSEEEKQALKNEYEGYEEKNFFQRRADLAYNDEYDRKQALYPNYREVKNEDAYKALIAHGVTEDEIKALNEEPITEEEAGRLRAQGMTDAQIEALADERNTAQQAARKKIEDLIYSIDDSWGVTAEDITNMIEDRYANPEIEKEALKTPISSSVFSLATNPVESAFSVGANAYNYVAGKPMRDYNTYTDLTRNTITENIDNQFGRTVYGGAMSIGDMAVAAGLAYATGGGSIVSAGVQALEKASQVMDEDVERNLTPDQIFAEGIASGVTTYVTEQIPMGKLDQIAKRGLTEYTKKEIGKTLGSMFLTEGLQEAEEDIADWVMDRAVALDKNEFDADVQNYISQGMTKKEATLKVIADRGVEMFTDFVIGGIGGGVMGGAGSGLAYATGKVQSNPSVYTDKVMNSEFALDELKSAVDSIDTTNLVGEDLERVEHAKEVANKANPTKEDVVDMANVLNEQANAENRLADVINDINYQASVDQNLNEYAENKEITPKEYETEIEKAARNKAESIAVQMEKAEREALRSREKALRDYEIKGIKSKLGEALNNIAQDFENEAAQKNFLENYKGQNASWYAEASLQAFHAGESGQSFNTFLENSREANLLLSENQVTEAYLKTLFYNGQNARTEESTEIKLAKNPNRGLATGGVDELTDLKQKIAEKLGVEVATNFEDAVQRGDFAVALARITVNATADNQYSALMHEMFEFARAYNPKGMAVTEKTIVDMLVNKRGEKAFVSAVNSYKEAYRKAGREAEEGSSLKAEANKTFSEAQEEFVNDAISYIFSTEEGMNTFVDYLMNDKSTTQTEKVSALQAIKDWIDKLIKSIKSFISKAENKNKQLGYEYAELANFNTDELEKLSRLLTGVLDEARENLARMTETSGKAEGETAHSVEVPVQNEIDVDGQKIKTNKDGTIAYIDGIEVAVIKDRVFSSRDLKKDTALVKNLIRDHIKTLAADPEKRKVFIKSDNQTAYFDNTGANKFVYGTSVDPHSKEYRAKLNAAVDVRNIVENATDKWHEVDKNQKHGDLAKRGWDYYIVDFVLADTDGKYSHWMGRLCIRLDANENDYIYDIDKIYKQEETPRDRIISAIKGAASPLISSVSDSEENSKTQDIVEGATEQQIEFSLPVMDSEGRKLSKEQQEYFKDSKIRDEEGNLLKVYHGSMADFTVFDIGEARDSEDIEAFFFSPVSEEAEGYGNTRAFYLNITNPADFDTAYDIFFKHRKENPAGAGARAREELISLGYDGVAAIDPSDPEYPEYLAFYPEQIKLVSNTKPTEDADIRFSLDVPIEETKDLIAVHNIHEDELMKTLELGGFPMPSIAITKANMGHDKYGNISVLFRKDTIDPQKYAGANKVYSGDAYTPEFPQVDYKINSKKAKNLYKKIEDIIKAIPYIDKNMVSLAESNLESKLNSHSGDPVEAYRNNNILKNAYLEDKGIKINMPMKEFPISDYHDNSTMIKIADLFNDEDMELYKDSPYSLYDELKKDGRLDQIIKIFNEEERAKLSDDKKYERWRTKEINENRYGSIMYAISKYKNEGLGEKPDMLAYTNLVDEKVQNNQKDYIKWISDLFDGVVEKPGIYNGKDYIKASGNRRSWDELHYEYTLKNIVDAMKQEPDTGSGVGGYSFFGSATREYSSIEDIKADKDRLRMIDDEEYMKLQHEIADELNVIAARISNKTGIGEISAMSDIAEAVAKNKTAAGVKKFLSKDYRVTDNDIAQIMALEKRVEQLPTGYFEAKPQRAVGFDEIAAVVIPDNDTEVKEKLEEKNIPVVTYKAGDTKSRIDAVNSVEDIRFSLSVSVDSEGNKLSEGQQDFFADSKVRDDQGHLLVMYHGTPNGTFTVFRGGTYFTNMAWYADRYQNQGASSLGYKKTADNPKTYAAYLNITKPFDTRDPKVRKIWDEQYYQKWDTGEITERGLPDWTSAEGLIEFIEENGYDFDGIIIDEGGVEDGKGGVTSRGFAWIPLKGEDQVKDINNLNPTNNPDYRFSIAVDSKGNSLSKGQQRFFKNSKVRDENGNLKVMYHGTERGGFTVFDPEFSDDGISLFFTDDKDIAKAYSGTDKEIKLYRTAKDLEELIHDSYTHIVKDGNTYRIINGFDDDAVTEFEGNFDELKEYVEEQYGVEDATNYKVYLNAENPLIIDAKGNNWDEIPEVVKGLTTTREYAVYAKENGYDSVIINNVVDSGVNADSSSRYKNTQVVIVFDSNQVKSVDNLNPTDDPDIRHSVDVPSDAFFDAFQEVEEQVKIDESDLEKFIKNGDLESDVTKKAVKDVASAIKKQYNSNIKLDRLTADIMSVFKYLKSTGNMSMKDIMFVMKEIARPVLEDVKTSDPEQEKMYKDFINKLKGYKISLDAGQTAEVAHSFGSYYEFQRAMNGKMNLSKNGTPLDNIWTELCDISNGHLSYGTNPNDQPLALAEYIYGLQPSYQTMEGETLDDAATDLALEIFRQFYVYQSMTDAASKVKGELNKRANEYKNRYKKAYNDALKQVEMERNLNIERLAKELDNLTAEEQEALRTGDALNKAMIENLKADYQRRLDRLRAQSNEKIAREKAKFQNAWITKNLKRERSELKNRVLREVKALQNLIAHPSEGATKHVPINLIKPTIEMLEAINLDNGGRNKAIAERLKKMAEVYESFKGEEYSFDYDERIANDIKELQEMFENKSYADLEIMELERVIEIVTALKTQIKNANNLILQGKLKDAQEAASSAMSSVRQSRRYDNAAMNALNKYANVHLNAYREFRKLSGYMGGALMDIYEDLDTGSKKEMQIQKDLGAIFQSVLEGKENQKEVKKFISTKKDDLVDIGLTDKNGKPILITRAMRMSLIMHSMNASNMRHVLGSGITIPNMYYFEKGKMDEAYAKGTNYRFVDYAQLLEAIQKNDTAKIEELTKAAEQRIEDMKKDLSEWEKKFLAAAEEMFHEKTGKYINETSLALKGYAIARVKNYFPIKTDAHFTTQEWAGLVQNGSLEGSGVLKERVVSTKPILLEDITNVIERQIRFTSKYAGLAIAVRNFETIMKQTSRSQTDGQLHNLYETIDSVWGASDTKWLKNLMQDIQGGRSEAKSWLMNLRGQFAGATLTLNPSVAIKQAASYPTAAAVVGYKALGKAMADMRKGFISQEGIKELEEINPLLWYRNQGNATQELADAKAVGFGKALPQWMQKAINWTQWFDTGTVRTLEYASKYYVDEHFPKLEKGSEEYWNKVSEVFTNVVEQTQPNYSTLHKADIIRNPNSFVKMLVMFKTQPMQNFGIVYDAMGELNAAKISGNKKWISEASSKAALAISSQAISATVFSAMTILSQLLLHRWWKYRDDEGKWSWEKFWVALGEGALSCFTGAFIGGSELYEALKHIFTGSTYYGIEVSVAEMVNDFVENIGKMTQNAKSLWDSKTEADRESAAQKLLKSSINLGATAGEFEGTPVNNIKNMLSAMYFYATDIVNSIDEGELSISDDSNIATWEIETQYERIYQSLNDPERYDKLVNELKDKAKAENPDLTEEEIADKVEKNVTDNITKLVKKDYLEGEISYEDTEKYLEEEKGKTEDEAFFQIREWETGESTYGVLKNTVSEAAKNPNSQTRKAVIDEVNVLLEHGKDKSDISSTLTRNFKAEYIELYNQNKAADLNAILRTALVTMGYSDEDAKKRISDWLK